MTLYSRVSRPISFRLAPLAGLLLAAPLVAQQPALKHRTPAPAAATTSAQTPSQTDVNRSSAYYHYGLAHLYEEMAVSQGRQDLATQAVEQYKLALGADPSSSLLQDGLADLYFKIGRIKDAVTAAQVQVEHNPNDAEAHTLLGEVYLRSLNDMQGPQATQMLQLAIAEYETLARLKPNDLETKLLLGQLYALNHDSARAEAQFKAAQKLDADSEDVVLNMARLYVQNGEPQRAIETLLAMPEDDRTARTEFELGSVYDQMKKPKEAAEAYQHSLDLEPETPEVLRALANALLADGQLDAALKAYRALIAVDPTDAQSQIHISEIQRRQGHFEDALATLEKAKAQAPDSLEVPFNEALIYDSLGKYDQAVTVLTGMLNTTAHTDANYTEQEKQNRAIFLNRLGLVYREQGNTAAAVAAYRQIADMGGDCTSPTVADDSSQPCYARDGYQGEVDTYRDAHQWKDATAVAADAARTLPKDKLVQMMYAQQLADTGQVEQGLALAKAQLTGGPSDRDIQEGLAQLYIRLKRFDEASVEIDKASLTAKSPDDKLYVLFLRGELLDRQKQHDLAEVQFRQALKIDPDNAEVLNYLGYMLADEGKELPDALTMISKAVELDPQNGAYLDSLGWVYFKSGQYPLAEENLHKAIDRLSSDPTVHDHLGELYEKTGKLKLAVAQWERSMTEYAHSLPADADPEDVQKVQHRLQNARVKLARLTPASEKNAR